MILMIIIIDTESEKLINKATNIYIFFIIWEAGTHMKSHAYLFIFLQEHIHTHTRGAFHLTWHSSQ